MLSLTKHAVRVYISNTKIARAWASVIITTNLRKKYSKEELVVIEGVAKEASKEVISAMESLGTTIDHRQGRKPSFNKE